MLPNSKFYSTPSNTLEVVNQDHKSSTLKLPQYLDSVSFGTSPSSIPVTMVILDNVSRYHDDHRSALAVGWQRHMYLDYKNSPLGDGNGNHQ